MKKITTKFNTLKKMAAIVLVASIGTQAVPTAALADNEGAGTIIGGILGAIVGNRFGRGGARVGATVVGAVVGAAIGRRVGQRMDDSDRRAWARAHRRCLEGNMNRPYVWYGSEYGSRTGARGEFIVVREGYHVETRQVCREYKSVIYVNGEKEVYRGYACRAKTSWTEVSYNRIYFR